MEMRIKTWWMMLILIVGTGCSTMPIVTSPAVKEALGHGEFEFEIDHLRASTDWSRDYGKGLEVDVWVRCRPIDYSPDLRMELNSAAQVIKTISEDDLGVQYEYVQIRLFNDFGIMGLQERRIVGVANVLLTRERILMLRRGGNTAQEYAQQWDFLGGYKDQPDSALLLHWSRGNAQPVAEGDHTR